MEQGEIILYQPDEAVKLEVRLEDETVWLTQAQIVDLFQSSKANISEHIKNAFDRGQGSTHKKIYLLGMLSDSPFKF